MIVLYSQLSYFSKVICDVKTVVSGGHSAPQTENRLQIFIFYV